MPSWSKFFAPLLVALLVASLVVALTRQGSNDPKPQIGTAVCVKTTVYPGGRVHTESCIP